MKLYIYIVYVSILHMPRTQQVATLSEAAELKLWSLKRGQPETAKWLRRLGILRMDWICLIWNIFTGNYMGFFTYIFYYGKYRGFRFQFSGFNQSDDLWIIHHQY